MYLPWELQTLVPASLKSSPVRDQVWPMGLETSETLTDLLLLSKKLLRKVTRNVRNLLHA